MAGEKTHVFVVTDVHGDEKNITFKIVSKTERYYFSSDTENEIIPLLTGYSNFKSKNYALANCSSTLIKAPNNVNIIVDTATAWDSKTIVSELQKHNLTPDDITYVVCTHGHADHVGCNFLFTKACLHFIGTCGHFHNKFYEIDFKNTDYDIVEGVRLIHTPGHTAECVSVIVKGKFMEEKNVIVGITGDLFENENDVKYPDLWICCGTPEFKITQALSRINVINGVHYIIPGHDKYFAVTEEKKQLVNNQLDDVKKAF